MQVMPFWTRVIGDGDPGKLFQMQTNLRFGCVILPLPGSNANGDLFMALGRYNGSRASHPIPTGVPPSAVFAAVAARRLASALPCLLPLSPMGTPPARACAV